MIALSYSGLNGYGACGWFAVGSNDCILPFGAKWAQSLRVVWWRRGMIALPRSGLNGYGASGRFDGGAMIALSRSGLNGCGVCGRFDGGGYDCIASFGAKRVLWQLWVR